MSDHTHTCADCGHVWECEDYTLKKCHKTGVSRAAIVNKQGPFCNLCLHLEMAKRYAEHRGLVLTWDLRPMKKVRAA